MRRETRDGLEVLTVVGLFVFVSLVLIWGVSCGRRRQVEKQDFGAHPTYCALDNPGRCIAIRSDHTEVIEDADSLTVKRHGAEIFHYVGHFSCSPIPENIGTNASGCTALRTADDAPSTKAGTP